MEPFECTYGSLVVEIGLGGAPLRECLLVRDASAACTPSGVTKRVVRPRKQFAQTWFGACTTETELRASLARSVLPISTGAGTTFLDRFWASGCALVECEGDLVGCLSEDSRGMSFAHAIEFAAVLAAKCASRVDVERKMLRVREEG